MYLCIYHDYMCVLNNDKLSACVDQLDVHVLHELGIQLLSASVPPGGPLGRHQWLPQQPKPIQT